MASDDYNPDGDGKPGNMSFDPMRFGLRRLIKRRMKTTDHEHDWRDSGFANLDDCAIEGCEATRQHPN